MNGWCHHLVDRCLDKRRPVSAEEETVGLACHLPAQDGAGVGNGKQSRELMSTPEEESREMREGRGLTRERREGPEENRKKEHLPTGARTDGCGFEANSNSGPVLVLSFLCSGLIC